MTRYSIRLLCGGSLASLILVSACGAQPVKARENRTITFSMAEWMAGEPPKGEVAAIEPEVDGGNAALSATLWMQTSAEYRAMVRQTFGSAERRLRDALNDRRWTAAPREQGANYEALPPAVILDVDETLLDNSPYQARLIKDRASFAPESFASWCQEQKATAMPGAERFAQSAVDLKIAVFYVTNRPKSLEATTRAQLAALGFPLDEETDTILTRGEDPQWASGKSTRRAHIARTHRILMVIGDDLGDFIDDHKVPAAQRRSLAEGHDDLWGARWILLPNPAYGPWEGAVLSFDGALGEADRVKIKMGALRDGRGATSAPTPPPPPLEVAP